MADEREGTSCSYFLKRKNRLCKMRRVKGAKYCGEHLNIDGEDEVSPISPWNSIFPRRVNCLSVILLHSVLVGREFRVLWTPSSKFAVYGLWSVLREAIFSRGAYYFQPCCRSQADVSWNNFDKHHLHTASLYQSVHEYGLYKNTI